MWAWCVLVGIFALFERVEASLEKRGRTVYLPFHGVPTRFGPQDHRMIKWLCRACLVVLLVLPILY